MTLEQIKHHKRFLDSLNADYIVGGSTLLGIIRDGDVFKDDNEFDIFMRVEEIERTEIKKYAYEILGSQSKHGLIFIDNNGPMTITPLLRYKEVDYINPSYKMFFIFNKGIEKDICKFGDIDLPIVKNPKIYFSLYYGEKWKEEDKSWNWMKSPMMQIAESIDCLIK